MRGLTLPRGQRGLCRHGGRFGDGLIGQILEGVPDELYKAPRSWAERAYPDNRIHYNRLDPGGHFAAREQPSLFVAEMRASFRIIALAAMW